MFSVLLSTSLFASVALSQSLTDATNAYAQLSQFRSLVAARPDLLPPVNASSKLTILIPNDAAFQEYQTRTGKSVASLDAETLRNHFQYHTVDSGVDLNSKPAGTDILATTELTDETYNNRNGTAGQVLFFNAGTKNDSATVKSGASYKVNMDVVDAKFTGGSFQIVDGFLRLPKTCTETMNDPKNQYTALVDALARSNLTDTLNNAPNVTCLAPNNNAFKAAGSPQTTLDPTTLGGALFNHTLAGAQYSTELKDGAVFTALGGGIVQISIKQNGDIYFNDAKVLNLNVITNNGVIHELDRIMSFPSNVSSVSTSSTSSTSGTTAKPTATPTTSAATSVSSTAGTATVTSNAAAGRNLESVYLSGLMAVIAMII